MDTIATTWKAIIGMATVVPCPKYSNTIDGVEEGCIVLTIGVQVRCPVGEAYDLRGLSCSEEFDTMTCPRQTHFCYTYNIDGYSGALCCPSICPRNFVEENGRCYSLDPGLWTTKLESGAMPCQVDAQCNYDGNAARCSNGK